MRTFFRVKIRWPKVIFIALVITLGILLAHKTHVARRIARANAYAAEIRSRIAADARFAEVTVTGSADYDGSVRLEGTVPTDADFEDLRKILISPPVIVSWHVGRRNEVPASATATSPASNG